MKKFSGLILAMLMALGISSAANAAITFDIDFYGTDFHGTEWEQGVMDTGEVIDLNVCNTVNVDLWVRNVPVVPAVDGGIKGFGFGFGVLPGAEINFELLDLEIITGADMFGKSEIFPGGLYAESLSFDWLNGDFLMTTFKLHCTAVSVDELWLYDYLPDTSQWVLGDGTVIDSEIFPQHLADVNQVPIPGAVWLLGSGLLGLVGTGLRRKKRS